MSNSAFSRAQLPTPITPANGGTGIANNNASTIAISGSFATTFTVTATTGVTLPTSGTLYGTASGSITSAQLATSLTDETGSGANVFGTSPTFTTSILAAANTANIGSTTTGWAHLYMASGGVLDFNNGNYTVTHSAGLLTTNGNLSLTTSGVLTTGTIELGAASDTTLSRAAAGDLAVEGVSVLTTSNTKTATNKRITRRLTTTSGPGATPTTNTDNVDIMNFTALAAAITSMTTNLSGTPVDGDLVEFRFTDNGTARAITWGASFAATTVALPTTTVISTMLRVLFEWNSTASVWQCLATA